MEGFGRYRECRWRQLGDIGSADGGIWGMSGVLSARPNHGVWRLGSVDWVPILEAYLHPPHLRPPHLHLHPPTPWSTSHTLEHQPHPGAPAPPWSTSPTLEHQPHPGTPATSWSTGHILEHQPHPGAPATSRSTSHILEHQPHLGAPATSWSTNHTLEHQPHPGAPATPWSTSHTLEVITGYRLCRRPLQYSTN